MKNEIIKHALLNVDNNTKNKSNNSLTRIIYPFHHKQNRFSLLLNTKPFKKSRKTVISRHSIRSNNKLNKKIIFEKNVKENINDKKEKIIDVNQFYNIRKKIYKNLKKPYISPYLENSLSQKKYFNEVKNPSFIEGKIKIYDYFQICYLINKEIKNYRLLSRFNDYIIFNDDQEYLMKYFNDKEYYIIMNYLLYQVYSKDILVISNKLLKKKLPDEIIINSFNKLLENNFIFKENIENRDDNENYSRNRKANSKRKKEYFENTNLKPVLKSNIDYIYVKDIPKHLVPNCSPNLFPNSIFQSVNFKIYLNLRKNNIAFLPKKSELLREKNQNDSEKNFKNLNFKDKYFVEDIFEDNKENLCDNISSEEDNKLENKNLQYKIMNKNKTNILDEDDKDIENFLFRLNSSLPKTKINKEKIVSLKNGRFKFNQFKKMDFFKENKSKINEDNSNSFIKNKNNIILNNKNHFIKIAQKSMFKTSLSGTISFTKIDKNTSQRSKYFNPNSSINDRIKKISSYNSNLRSTRNKKDKSQIIRNILKKANLKLKNSIIKAKTLSGKLTTKSLYYEIFNNNSKIIENNLYNNNASIINSNSKSSKNAISYSTINRIHNGYFKNPSEKNIKEFRNNKIIGLYEFEKLYEETKRKGLLPKTKINYNTIFRKAFDSFVGFNFLKYIENRGYNKHIELEENKSLNDYSFEKLKKIIKQFRNKNKLFNKNNFSLQTLIKSPNLYSH